MCVRTDDWSSAVRVQFFQTHAGDFTGLTGGFGHQTLILGRCDHPEKKSPEKKFSGLFSFYYDPGRFEDSLTAYLGVMIRD